MKFFPIPLIIVLLLGVLAGCAPPTHPDTDYSLQREAIAGSHAPVPPPPAATQIEPLVQVTPPATESIGSGQFINERAARAPMPSFGGHGAGSITFNFENQPIQAAVKAILGDVLHANYVISPGVTGTVTFSTSQPIGHDDVLPVLEMLLSWTNNALVRNGNRYVVLPAKDAAAGNLVPGLGAAAPGRGYAARLFPLHYVSADAMQKLLKPFARPDAFLLVDPQRNVLVMAGSPEELANYQRTVRTFDVDWLQGMSVAVIPLQHVEAGTLMPQLDQMFGAKGDSPMAGMARFIPLEHSNSLVVITPQPRYLDEVREFIAKIDSGAAGSSGLYVYDVKNIKASDLAEHLNALYNGTSGGGNNTNGQVAPGFSPLEQGRNGLGSASAIGNSGFGGSNNGTSDNGGKDSSGDNGLGTSNDTNGGMGGSLESGLPQRRNGGNNGAPAGTASYTTESGVHIAAVDENNQLLVRARSSQWEEMLPVIERLDQVPLQVQIETRVLEIDLTGQFSFGVQSYFNGLIGSQPGSPPGVGNPFDHRQGAVGLGGTQYNRATDALFYSFAGRDFQIAIKGLEESGNTKVLSEPSTVVLNNHETTIKVGDKIPVVQTYFAPGLGTIGSTQQNGVNVGQVQYIDTGVLLDVTPRVNPGGLVYMDIQQVVSKPTSQDQFGNFTIANRALSTQVAVQSGQTVLLGGLIQQSDDDSNNGVPYLNRVPLLGRLFGTTSRNHDRKELIVLITPHVIGNAEQAREITDEYQNKFESLAPILPQPVRKTTTITTTTTVRH
ncbi:MAG: type II secretion system secretin GspD [Rhodanobacteraceae bacterium]